MDIKIFYEDELLKISYIDDSTSNRCLVAFTGIGHAMGGIDVQREEFFSQHRLGMVVWVTDKQRSWGNNLHIEEISKAIKRLVGEREIFIIGNSMGGFLGVLFSSALNAKRVMAFVPQFSVSPKIVPTETRWMKYRKEIQTFVYEDLRNSFNNHIDYALLLGSGDEEDVHYRKFSEVENNQNIQLFRFTGTDHYVARYLKELNVLNECIDAFFGGDSLTGFFEQRNIELLSS